MKKLPDLICFVIGPSLLIFSVFSFDHEGLLGMEGSNPLYYPIMAKVGIGVGAALICLGVLMTKWRKNISS